MAVVQYGSLISQARNKCGTQVFARNRQGDYVRAWKPITQTPSRYRDTVWNCYRACAEQWKNELTDAQRLAWAAFAERYPITKSLSGTYPLAGWQCYLQHNALLNYTGFSSNPDPGPDNNVTLPTSLTITANTSSPQLLVVTFTPLLPQDGSDEVEIVMLSCTPQSSAGRLSIPRKIRAFTIALSPFAPPYDITTDYLASGRTLTAGQRVHILAKFIRGTNGASSRNIHASSVTL